MRLAEISAPPAGSGRTPMAAVLAGLVLLWLLLDRSAAMLGSFRGEYGLLVCALVLTAAIGTEMLVGRRGLAATVAALGLHGPNRRGLVWSLAFVALLALFFPAYALATGTTMALRPDWFWLVPGLLAQGGLAEETIFRGFLFRHMRAGRTFWRAALVSALPFIAVHLPLFATFEPALAAASLVLALSISLPLAWLFERSGNSIWPPAIVHFAVQGFIKLVETEAAAFLPLAATWMVVSCIGPWVFFALRTRPSDAG